MSQEKVWDLSSLHAVRSLQNLSVVSMCESSVLCSVCGEYPSLVQGDTHQYPGMQGKS